MMWNCPGCPDGVVQDWRRPEDCSLGETPVRYLDAPCAGCGKGETSLGCHRGCGKGYCVGCLLDHYHALARADGREKG